MAKKTTKKKLEVVYLAISSLKTAAYNPNVLSATKEKQLTLSMGYFGAVEPIVVNRKTMTIVGGHHRRNVLLRAGEKEAPCILVDLSLADEKRLSLALNNIHGEAGRDILKELLEDLDTGDFDWNTMGFSEAEVEELMTACVPAENEKIDEENNTKNECPKCGFKWYSERIKKL